MNKIEIIKKLLLDGFNNQIQLKERRPNIYQIFTPFYHEDGDMIDVFVEIMDNDLIKIEDLGMTLMRLSYDLEIDTKKRKEIFSSILSNYQVNIEKGNIYSVASISEIYPYLMEFIQVIVKVSDLSFLRKEYVKTLFFEDFEFFVNDGIKKAFSSLTVKKDYTPDFDENGEYKAPYLLQAENVKPMTIFPVNSDDKCNEVTITTQKYKLKDFKTKNLVIFEDQTSISRVPLARLSNEVDKQFSSFRQNEKNIIEYINDNMFAPNLS